MCQIAGGEVGLGPTTEVVVSAAPLIQGIHDAFVNTGFGLVGLAVTVLFIGGRMSGRP